MTIYSSTTKVNDLVHDCCQIATDKGFHNDTGVGPHLFETEPRSVLSWLMLITTEVAEAAEAVRHGDRKNFEEELADICIRVFDTAGVLDIDLEKAIVDKINVNIDRENMHGGKRA